jgi:hypothetical protein
MVIDPRARGNGAPPVARTRVETARQKQAFADYLALGPGRSLQALFDYYQRQSHPPVRNLTRLKDWSRWFDWQGRVDRAAAVSIVSVEQAAADERERLLTSGYAQQHERIGALNQLATALMGSLFSASGDALLTRTERMTLKDGVVIEREVFRKPELEQLRGLLDDLAKETGGRQRNVRIDGNVNGDVTVHHVTEEERLDRTAQVLQVLQDAGVLGAAQAGEAPRLIDATAVAVETPHAA